MTHIKNVERQGLRVGFCDRPLDSITIHNSWTAGPSQLLREYYAPSR